MNALLPILLSMLLFVPMSATVVYETAPSQVIHFSEAKTEQILDIPIATQEPWMTPEPIPWSTPEPEAVSRPPTTVHHMPDIPFATISPMATPEPQPSPPPAVSSPACSHSFGPWTSHTQEDIYLEDAFCCYLRVSLTRRTCDYCLQNEYQVSTSLHDHIRGTSFCDRCGLHLAQPVIVAPLR